MSKLSKGASRGDVDKGKRRKRLSLGGDLKHPRVVKKTPCLSKKPAGDLGKIGANIILFLMNINNFILATF